MTEDYEPFGPEWEKEVNRFSKPMLIDWLRRVLKEKEVQKTMIEELILIANSYEMCFPKNNTSQKKKVQDTIYKAIKLTDGNIEDIKRQWREDRNQRKNESLK